MWSHVISFQHTTQTLLWSWGCSFPCGLSMSFITKESKHFINDDDNGFIFTAYCWAASLAGVTAALWMENGCTDVLRSTFLSSLRSANGLWFEFSADSVPLFIAYDQTTFTTGETVKAQDFHKPKLCKARINLSNLLWETDVRICPEQTTMW